MNGFGCKIDMSFQKNTKISELKVDSYKMVYKNGYLRSLVCLYRQHYFNTHNTVYM